jgi:hypothetical protein
MATPEAVPAADAAVYRAARIRRAIYVTTAAASILITYGGSKHWHWLGPEEIAAWGSVVALVNGLAAFNVQAGPPR